MLRNCKFLRISAPQIEMNYLFWAYVFTSFMVISGSAYYFYSQSQEVAAGIMLFGLLITSIYFGLRWFPTPGSQITPTGSWPPVINYCPDFLTLYVINGEQVCLDTVGVSQAGGMSKWSDPTQQDEKYLFHLFLNTSGPDRIKKLCDQANAKRVNWEGVWDGAVCMNVDPPPPPPRS
jgi:hypothetical protein